MRTPWLVVRNSPPLSSASCCRSARLSSLSGSSGTRFCFSSGLLLVVFFRVGIALSQSEIELLFYLETSAKRLWISPFGFASLWPLQLRFLHPLFLREAAALPAFPASASITHAS